MVFRCYGLKLKEKSNFRTPSACELIRLTAVSSCSKAMRKEISAFMNSCPGATSSRTLFSRARTRQMTLFYVDHVCDCLACFQCESSEAAAVCEGCCFCGVINAPDSCPDSSCIPQQDPPRSSSALPLSSTSVTRSLFLLLPFRLLDPHIFLYLVQAKKKIK